MFNRGSIKKVSGQWRFLRHGPGHDRLLWPRLASSRQGRGLADGGSDGGGAAVGDDGGYGARPQLYSDDRFEQAVILRGRTSQLIA